MNQPFQQQVIPIEVKFKGPLVKDSIVQTVDDLLQLNNNFNYEHKLIWVKNEESFYYLLNNFDGSDLQHWRKFQTRATIEKYNFNKPYSNGDIVYYNNKIYLANASVSPNQTPLSHLNLWISLSGSVETTRLMFENVDSFYFYTNIINPVFTTILGEIQKQPGGEIIFDTDGMVKLNNQEIVEAFIERDYSKQDLNGKAYKVTFMENGEPSQKSGVISIK